MINRRWVRSRPTGLLKIILKELCCGKAKLANYFAKLAQQFNNLTLQFSDLTPQFSDLAQQFSETGTAV